MELYQEKGNCCGCGSCMNICPVQAITMEEDLYGFKYPKIDENICIQCGACQKVCGFGGQEEKKEPVKVYAAGRKDADKIMQSASGGIFAVLAEQVLAEKGVVYGAAMESREGKLFVEHIRVDELKNLYRLLGSKYVQSDMGETYQKVKQDVLKGKQVLFSGTPCQVQGLQRYLKKQYDNLITTDIICHGVPGQKMFQDFIKLEEKKEKGKIHQFYFRDKSKGQAMISKIVCESSKKGTREITKHGMLYSYVCLFLKAHIYRDSCYQCPYACRERVADITLGDYWDFNQEHPEYNKENGLSDAKGISCILVQTEKGAKLLQKVEQGLEMMESVFEKVAKHNGQLTHATQRSSQRDKILDLYKEQGYEAVDSYYKKNFQKERIVYKMVNMMPRNLKRKIKTLKNRLVIEK